MKNESHNTESEFEIESESPEDTDSAESTGAIPDLAGQLSDFSPSRRDFLSNTAKAGAGAAALGVLGTGTAAAAHADEPYSNSPYEDKNRYGYGALTDREIIRFALILERLEATFYTEAVGNTPIDKNEGSNGAGPDARLSEEQLESSKIANQFANPSLQFSTFVRLKQVRNHEQAHVDALQGVLKEVGGNPDFGSSLQFQFPYEDVEEFYDLAQVFEDTGAGAYTAAAPAVDTEEYLAAAAQILAVEARHASYFRTLNNPLPYGTGALNPFPRAFQQRLSVKTVAQRVIPFIKGVDDVSQVLKLVTTGQSDMKGTQPDVATVTFNDQTTDGSSVTVASATVPDGGFVAMHNSSLLDGNVIGSVIGVSQKLDAGTYMNVEVPLYTGVPGATFDQSALQEDQTLIAMPHRDTNGNGTYDFITSGGKKDGAYTQDGSAVIDKASIRVT
jgi:rubrerythrin